MAVVPQPTTTQQKYVDILYEFQCCIASKAEKLNELDEIGNDCYEEKFAELATIIMVFETLLCENIEEPVCLTEEEILNMLSYLKKVCQNCCTDIKGLKNY